MARRKQQDVTENPLYHDTWKLLQKYRDVVWSMELSVQQVRTSFESEFGRTIDDFLDSIYSAGADLSGTEIEQHARCIQRSNQMIKLALFRYGQHQWTGGRTSLPQSFQKERLPITEVTGSIQYAVI